jgi:hypothetical protein
MIPWLRIAINQREIVPPQEVDKDHLDLDTREISTRACAFASTEIRSCVTDHGEPVSVQIGVGGMSHAEEAHYVECIQIREDGSIVGERPGWAEESCSFGQISTVREGDTT